MKALSLWQPWASLVAVGAKTIETRHWPPARALLGERIAIHAAKTTSHLDLARFDARFAGALERYRHTGLPLGAIVATVRLVGVEQITPDLCRVLSGDELAFGNYSTGRYAWRLSDPILLKPIPTIGRQGFFDVPDPS